MMRKDQQTGGFISAETQSLLHKSNKKMMETSLSTLLDAPDRFEQFSRSVPGILFDFSRVRMDEVVLDRVVQVARDSKLERRRAALFDGENVNITEHRPALHMALRSPKVLNRVGGQEAQRVSDAMTQMREFAQALFDGRLPGDEGATVTDIVHVGIGGSLLGPQLVCDALDTGDSKIRVHFLGSVDALRRERLLQRLNPAETMVVLVSKSFTTGDTLLHGRRLRDWLIESLGAEAALARVFAVTSQVDRATEFGIDPARLLYFSDWVGGRYSVWSPVSLSAAALIGPGRFDRFLEGAATMDAHFQEANLRDNLPVLAALVGVWHRNICGFSAWGVMPYDQRLRLLPSYLQQLIMESNGKSVRLDGEVSGLETAAVVFGETGTEAQHSVFQAMHQGSNTIPINFVGVAKPDHSDREAHDELLANMLAQMTALARGRSADETRKAVGDLSPALLQQRTFPGNRPSDLLLLEQLTPHALGQLLAFYEHKVFVESVLWDINAFDQWGVELGKTLAPGIQSALAGQAGASTDLSSLLAHIAGLRD